MARNIYQLLARQAGLDAPATTLAMLPPAPGEGGTPVSGARSALIEVIVRDDPRARTCWAWLTTPDLTSTYEATIAGETVAYDAAADAPADAQELAEGWADAWNADASAADEATAEAVQRNGVWGVRWVQADETGRPFDAEVTGAGVIELEADAESVTVDWWGRDEQGGPWCRIQRMTVLAPLAPLSDGLTRIDCDGLAALAPVVTAVSGVAGDGADVEPYAAARLVTLGAP